MEYIVYKRFRDFYSRPCGRGDFKRDVATLVVGLISTHAPAGGATGAKRNKTDFLLFLLTPLREGRLAACWSFCPHHRFLLTPLREGRPRCGASA